MGEELKKTGAGNLFTVFGEPDIDIYEDRRRLRRRPQGRRHLRPDDWRGPEQRHQPDRAVDDRHRLQRESFFVRHCYFTGGNDPYKRLKTALKADIDEDAWESMYQTVSRPFPSSGGRQQDRGQGHQRLRRRSHEGLRGLTMAYGRPERAGRRPARARAASRSRRVGSPGRSASMASSRAGCLSD